MSFPSPSLAPPALSLYQVSFGGLTFGGINSASTYQLQSMTIDMPDVASGDVQRAVDQGEFAGMDVLPGADITIVQLVTTSGLPRFAVPTVAQAAAIDAACQALGGVMGPAGATEIPLWLQMASGTFVRMCRPRKHNCPWDINRAFAGAPVATSMLHSTDPRWYAAPSQSQSVGLSTGVPGGLAVSSATPAPWVLAAGLAANVVNVVNSGLFESRPVLVINGPCVNPVVTNSSLPGAPWVGVNQTLNPGDTLTIDMDWRSVVLRSAGSTVGAPRRNQIMQGSTWWNLPSQSSNAIVFTSQDVGTAAGTLTIQSASARLSL